MATANFFAEKINFYRLYLGKHFNINDLKKNNHQIYGF